MSNAAEIRIRLATPADAPGIARVQVDGWRATYRGMVPDAILDAMSYEASTPGWERGIKEITPERHLYVAACDEIIGFAMGGPNRAADSPEYAGELYAIYVLPDRQGGGTGRKLAAAVAADLIADGFNSMIVWALAANPYRRFYESLGGQFVREREIEIRGAMLAEVGYGWTDLSPLLP